jgi:hypothetical protein
MLRDSDNAAPCECTTCVVYGGDCQYVLGVEAMRETMGRWRRRGGSSGVFARFTDTFGNPSSRVERREDFHADDGL